MEKAGAHARSKHSAQRVGHNTRTDVAAGSMAPRWAIQFFRLRLHVPPDSVIFMSMSIVFLMPTPRTADVLFFTAFEFCMSSTAGLTGVTSVVLVSFADNNAAQMSAAKMLINIFIFTMVATERRVTRRLS